MCNLAAALPGQCDLIIARPVWPNNVSSDRHFCTLCRQLLTGVLASCKPCWLAEPQLLQDVSSKLLVDLQQQLTAWTATSQQAVTAALDHGQQEQEQQKFLALLSCLVAILHAAMCEPGCQHVVMESASLLLSAHATYSQQSAERGEWISCLAAAAVADLMLTFSRSLIAASSTDTASAAANNSTPGPEDTATNDVSSSADTDQAVNSVQTLDTDVVLRMWCTATDTLTVPQLTAELAITVMTGLNNTLTMVATAAAAGAPVHQHAAQPYLANQSQQQDADGAPAHSASLRQLASHMCEHIFTSTLTVR